MAGENKPARERLEPTGGATALERMLLARPPVRPNIGAVPRSDVFGRLSAFLPRMAAANADLEARLASGAAAPKDVDVTAVDEAAGGPVIEMDLACGVFDVRSGAALAAAERAIQAGPLEAGGGGGGGSGSSSDSETSSSYDDGDDEADSDDGGDDSSGGGEQGGGGAAAKGGSNGNGGASANLAKRRGGLKPPRKKLIQELPPKQE